MIYWDGAYRVNGQLAVSRAIGRFFYSVVKAAYFFGVCACIV